MDHTEFIRLLNATQIVLRQARDASRHWRRTYEPEKANADYIPNFLKNLETTLLSYQSISKWMPAMSDPLLTAPNIFKKEMLEEMEILIGIWRNLNCLDDFPPIKTFATQLYNTIHSELKLASNDPIVVFFYKIVSETKENLERFLKKLSAQEQLKLNLEIQHIHACIAHLLKIMFALPLKSTTDLSWHNKQLENIRHNLAQLKFLEIQFFIQQFFDLEVRSFTLKVMAFTRAWTEFSIEPLLQGILQQANAILKDNPTPSRFIIGLFTSQRSRLSTKDRELLTQIAQIIESALTQTPRTILNTHTRSAQELFAQMQLLITLWHKLSCLPAFPELQTFIPRLDEHIKDNLEPRAKCSIDPNDHQTMLFYKIISVTKEELVVFLENLKKEKKFNAKIEHIYILIAHLLTIIFELPLKNPRDPSWHKKQLQDVRVNLTQLNSRESQIFIDKFFDTSVIAFETTYSKFSTAESPSKKRRNLGTI